MPPMSLPAISGSGSGGNGEDATTAPHFNHPDLGMGGAGDGRFRVSRSGPDNAPGDRPPTGYTGPTIHPIKPPERPTPRPVWIYYAAVTALILLLALLLFRLLRRSHRNRSAPPVPALSPVRRALKNLGDLKDVDALDGRLFYFRLSAILREYLRGRFGLNAPEMTIEELLPRTRELDLPADLRGTLRSLLRNAEPIKFGGAPAVTRQMEQDLASAVAFVRETDPGSETAGKGKEPEGATADRRAAS